MKKVILHIIDSLGKGGAEMLLVGTINSLPQYTHIVVTLNKVNEFNEIHCDKIYSLEHSSNLSLFTSIKRLNNIIKKNQVSIVHSHLFWGTIIARLAIPKKCTLITTYHSLLYDQNNLAQYSKKMKLIDKITYRPKFHTIFISDKVKDNVTKAINIKENYQILNNFVEDSFFEKLKSYTTHSPLKIISVGNLRKEKNYLFLIKSLSNRPDLNISFDIYGDGKEKKALLSFLNENKITNIRLKGKSDNISELLTSYDLFLMGSTFEGFGIALVEAMAVGLPCLISNIDAFTEVTKNHGIFFDPTSTDSFIKKLEKILSGEINLMENGEKMKTIALSYSKKRYISQLIKLYN